MPAVRDLGLDIVRDHRRGDDLAVGMGDRGTGGRTEVLEHQYVAQARIGAVKLLHAFTVGAQQRRNMWLAHVVQRDAVLWMVDDDFVPAVAVYGLLQAEVEVGILAVITEYRIKILDDAYGPRRHGWWRYDPR